MNTGYLRIRHTPLSRLFVGPENTFPCNHRIDLLKIMQLLDFHTHDSLSLRTWVIAALSLFDRRIELGPGRSAERRVGKEFVSTCRARRTPYKSNKNKNTKSTKFSE